MKPLKIILLLRLKMSPPARGRGLKHQGIRVDITEEVCRPPRGGVD